MAKYIDQVTSSNVFGNKLKKWMTDLEAIPDARTRLVKADEFLEALTRIRYVEMMEGVVPPAFLQQLIQQSFGTQNTIDGFIGASRNFQTTTLDHVMPYSSEFLARNKRTGLVEVINPADLGGDLRIGEIKKHSANNDQYEVLGPRTLFEGKDSLLLDILHNFTKDIDLKKNMSQQVVKDDLSDADSFPFGNTIGGHASTKHNASKQDMAIVLNNPDKLYTGFSKAYRQVDLYYKDGRVVVTEKGDKTKIITSYNTRSTKSFDQDPNLVEVTHHR